MRYCTDALLYRCAVVPIVFYGASQGKTTSLEARAELCLDFYTKKLTILPSVVRAASVGSEGNPWPASAYLVDV